jgi:hypothetical protein
MKRVARPDAREHTVVVEPVVGVIQVELAVVGVAVHIQNATVAVRVLPETCGRPSAPPSLEIGRINRSRLLKIESNSGYPQYG